MAANVIFYLSGGEPYRGVAWIGWVQQQPIRPHRSASIYSSSRRYSMCVLPLHANLSLRLEVKH